MPRIKRKVSVPDPDVVAPTTDGADSKKRVRVIGRDKKKQQDSTDDAPLKKSVAGDSGAPSVVKADNRKLFAVVDAAAVKGGESRKRVTVYNAKKAPNFNFVERQTRRKVLCNKSLIIATAKEVGVVKDVGTPAGTESVDVPGQL
jgi:hypothetical protein